MDDDASALDQIEAMLRISGIKSEDSVSAILEMIEEYAGKSSRNRYGMQGDEYGCVCGELTSEVRSRLSALRSARMQPDIHRKPCSRCRQMIPLIDYHRDARKGDGRQGMCKACKREVEKIRRSEASIDPVWFGDSGLALD